MSVFSPEERELFERDVARFLSEEYGAERRGALIADGGFGAREWRRYSELGWLGVALPEAYGGVGGGLSDLLTLLHASGRGLLMEPLIATLVIAAPLIQALGTDAQKRDLLPRIAEGKLTLAFAHTATGAGETDGMLQFSRGRDAGSYRLHGERRAVLHAPNATRILATARGAADNAVGLFLLDPAAEGVTVRPYRMIDDQPAGDVTCHDVLVAGTDCLEGAAMASALESALGAAAIANAAAAAGAMEALNELSLDYAKTRTQFGKPIGTFQVLQHRLVDMMIAARQARTLARHAARAHDGNSPDWPRLASASKVTAGKAGRFVGEQAIQVHGGIGMTDEYAAGHYLKRLLLLGAQFGDAEFHLRRLAAEDHDSELPCSLPR